MEKYPTPPYDNDEEFPPMPSGPQLPHPAPPLTYTPSRQLRQPRTSEPTSASSDSSSHSLEAAEQIIPLQLLTIQSVMNDGSFIASAATNTTNKRIGLSRVILPKLGTPARKTAAGKQFPAVKTEPLGYECVCYLQNNMIGREILFMNEHTTAETKKELGIIFYDRNLERNLAYDLVSKGLANLREVGEFDWISSVLVEARIRAKNERLGMWALELPPVVEIAEADHDEIAEKYKGKFVHGTVDYVRDATNFRVILKPLKQTINVTLSGISIFPQFADKAKEFVGMRLHQRNVVVHIQAKLPGSKFPTIFGSIFLDDRSDEPSVLQCDQVDHTFDIAAYLLINGFGEICAWNLRNVLRQNVYYKCAERARQLKLKGYGDDSLALVSGLADQYFDGVVEFVHGNECLTVRGDNGAVRSVYLSSIRLPKTEEKTRPENMFNVPYYLEAREELRRLVGNRVRVSIDFESVVAAGANKGQRREYCTVLFNLENVGVRLVRLGLARVLNYRADDTRRSSAYHELIEAEGYAENARLGLHGPERKKRPIQHLVAEQAKSYLHSLAQSGRLDAVVEWVIAGSRFKLFIPSRDVTLIFALQGIAAPRRNQPFGEESVGFVSKFVLQRDVSVYVDGCDRSGCFLGRLFNGQIDLSRLLLQNGLAKLLDQATLLANYQDLASASNEARAASIGIWSLDSCPEESEEGEVEDPGYIGKISFSSISDDDVVLFVQSKRDYERAVGHLLELNSILSASSPPSEPVKPMKGRVVACKQEGKGWCRAFIRSIQNAGENVELCFVDSGEIVKEIPVAELREIPSQVSEALSKIPPLAKEVRLAYVRPNMLDEECLLELGALICLSGDAELKIENAYRTQNNQYVLISYEGNDKLEELVRYGMVVVRNQWEIPQKMRNSPIREKYAEAEAAAKLARAGVWRYGELIADDDASSNSRPRPVQRQ